MGMSCNGCRVLRKGCSEDCTIRPCLQWIKNPEAQGNATLFLAKFYGRAGLLNLINTGPDHLRPGIFRSLLYEACGRIVNPIYGSVGLLWSGNWNACQKAVDAVLKGAPVIHQLSSQKTPAPSTACTTTLLPPLKACDIRHVTRQFASGGRSTKEVPSIIHHSMASTSRPRFKRAGNVNNVERWRPFYIVLDGDARDGDNDRRNDCADNVVASSDGAASMDSVETVDEEQFAAAEAAAGGGYSHNCNGTTSGTCTGSADVKLELTLS